MNQDFDSPMDMDADTAKKLFNHGAVLIITGVPRKTEFGIDLCSYTIAENFRGVKMIPPGPHHVWCAATGPYGDTAPRVGFAHFFHEQEILVKEWDADNEELRDRQTKDPELEKLRIRENIKSLDSYLAAYDFRYWNEWRKLTDTVSHQTLERCQPSLGIIRTNVELQSCPDSERPRGPLNGAQPALAAKLLNNENDLLPQLKPVEGTAPRFSVVPDRVPKDCTPTEISRHSIDCIEACNELLKSFAQPQDLIEEVQLSFTFFLVGYSIESLEHWRRVLSILSHSEDAVAKYRILFMKYAEVLVHQLPRLPEELMEPSERNTVFKDIRSLLVNLSVSGLHKSAELLTKKLKSSMNWSFEGLLDEDPENMPVVVNDSN
ncbi:protein AAR2 homolog [Stomoxys calcitrans]|uniref:Protein AAR2 homolog n=1 Tax=Stomoxys calcitrans TaxID=35570 RepID=A0A1I8NY47_STOCA|nr:protein AAR2 homolog [Stomoxys calcitrans]